MAVSQHLPLMDFKKNMSSDLLHHRVNVALSMQASAICVTNGLSWEWKLSHYAYMDERITIWNVNCPHIEEQRWAWPKPLFLCCRCIREFAYQASAC